MRRILASAGLFLAVTGCGSSSGPAESASAIPLSIPSPAITGDVEKTEAPTSAISESRGTFETSAVQQLIQRANAAVVAGRNTLGIESLSQAIGIQPESAQLFRMRADVYVLQREMANARADFSTAVRLDPRNAQLYNFRGYFLMSQGLTKEALADFEQAITLDPSLAAAWNNKGLIGLARQDYESALLDFTKAVDADRTYVDGWNNRGFARMKLNQNEEALNDVQQALKLQENYPTAWNNCGLIYMQLGQFDKAETAFNRLIELEPMDARWLNHRRASLVKQEKFAEAQRDARQIEWLNELQQLTREANSNLKNPVPWIERAEHLMAKEQYGAAIQDFTRAILVNPGNVQALIGRGLAWSQTGDMQKAMMDCDEAIVANQGGDTRAASQAYSLRGDLWLALGKYDEAIEDFQTAGRFDDKVAEAYEKRAAGFRETMDDEKADADEAVAMEIREALSGNSERKSASQEKPTPFPDDLQ